MKKSILIALLMLYNIVIYAETVVKKLIVAMTVNYDN